MLNDCEISPTNYMIAFQQQRGWQMPDSLLLSCGTVLRPAALKRSQKLSEGEDFEIPNLFQLPEKKKQTSPAAKMVTTMSRYIIEQHRWQDWIDREAHQACRSYMFYFINL